jgi:subtilisin family serine protease
VDLKYNAPTINLAPIAILDTGLSTSNLDFDKFVISSLDVLSPNVEISDTLGHGTQMALIATGLIEPYGTGVQSSESYSPIIAIKAFDENGFITDFNIMESIDFALENHAKVMNLSWGTETNSAFMEKAFEYASSKGLIVVAAAGNEPTGNPVYPAATLMAQKNGLIQIMGALSLFMHLVLPICRWVITVNQESMQAPQSRLHMWQIPFPVFFHKIHLLPRKKFLSSSTLNISKFYCISFCNNLWNADCSY